MAVASNTTKATKSTKPSAKRKRLLENEDDPSQTRLTFKRVRRDEYEDAVGKEAAPSSSSDDAEDSQVSSKRPATSKLKPLPLPARLISNRSSRMRVPKRDTDKQHVQIQDTTVKLEPDTSQSTSPNSQMQLTSSNSIVLAESLIKTRQERIEEYHNHCLVAYTKAKELGTELKGLDNRLVISFMARMMIDHLIDTGHNVHGIIRAVLMEREGVDLDMVRQAWICAGRDTVFDLGELSPVQYSLNIDQHKHFDWEVWSTDEETVRLVEKPIKSVDADVLRLRLYWCYQMAAKLTWEIGFNKSPAYLLVTFTIRYLARQGYSLDRLLDAMVSQMRNESGVRQAWSDAQREEKEIQK